SDSTRVRKPSHRIGLNIIAVLVFVCSVFPLYWTVNLSFTPGNEIISRDPSLLPKAPTLINYITAWNRPAAPGQTDFPHALMTSLIVVAIGIVAALAVAFLASIALARFSFRGRHAFIVGILVVQMIPG